MISRAAFHLEKTQGYCVMVTFNILVVYKRRWSPYSNGAVI